MADAADERSTIARIAVCLLNLLAPGLGLIRVGAGRAGLILLLAPWAMLAALAAIFAAAPIFDFAAFVSLLIVLVAFVITFLCVSVMMTWRRSRYRASVRYWWSRWYMIAAIVVASDVAANIAVGGLHRFYKPYYLPSESMAPTLGRLDRMVADMRGGRTPAIGDMVLIATADATYVKRVVARAGDHVRMRAGVPIVNGRPAIQTVIGPTRFRSSRGIEPATLLRETLPGETGSHRVLDLGPSFLDDTDEQTVPPGMVYVLGDNRDRSADSRSPASDYGLDIVATSRIVGRPLYITWSADRASIGRAVAH